MRSLTVTLPFAHTHEYDDSTPVLIPVQAPGGRLREIAGREGSVSATHEGVDTTLARSGYLHRTLNEAGRGPETPSLTVNPETSATAYTALQAALERAAAYAAPNGFETADVVFVGTTETKSDLTSENDPYMHVTWNGDATVTWTRITGNATQFET